MLDISDLHARKRSLLHRYLPVYRLTDSTQERLFASADTAQHIFFFLSYQRVLLSSISERFLFVKRLVLRRWQKPAAPLISVRLRHSRCITGTKVRGEDSVPHNGSWRSQLGACFIK